MPMKIEKILNIFGLVSVILEALKNFLSASKNGPSEEPENLKENS